MSITTIRAFAIATRSARDVAIRGGAAPEGVGAAAGRRLEQLERAEMADPGERAVILAAARLEERNHPATGQSRLPACPVGL